MSDAKISELPQEHILSLTDIVPAVVNGETVKISLGDILNTFNVGGTAFLSGAVASVDTAVVSTTTFMSHVNGALTLPLGTANQIKFIVADSASTITASLASATFSTLTFVQNQTALLYFVDKWYIIASNCTVA